MVAKLQIPHGSVGALCRRRRIRRLSLFGSVVRDDFGPDSDVDVLVEFEVGSVPGFLGMAEIESELSLILGRQVDLRTAAELSRYFRQQVVDDAVTVCE